MSGWGMGSLFKQKYFDFLLEQLNLFQDIEPKLHIKKHDWKKTHVNMMAAIKEAKLCNNFLFIKKTKLFALT